MLIWLSCPFPTHSADTHSLRSHSSHSSASSLSLMPKYVPFFWISYFTTSGVLLPPVPSCAGSIGQTSNGPLYLASCEWFSNRYCPLSHMIGSIIVWSIAMPPWFLLGSGPDASNVFPILTGLHPLCGFLLFIEFDERLSKLYATHLIRFVASTPLSASAVTLSRGVLPVSEFPRMLSRSNSISGADSPPKSATSAIRRRRWGTPQNCASSILQAMLHPSPMIHPAVVHLSFGGRGITAFGSTTCDVSSRTHLKSSDLFEDSAPGTFSHTIYLGLMFSPVLPRCASALLNSLISLICSMNSPERSPERPFLCPAMLKS